jgi:shikimate kinase
MPRANICLIGFMGTGKSVAGKALAKALKRPFKDSDALIERRAGKPVAAIFASGGEKRFRALERGVIAKLCKTGGQVISLGGGALLDSRNADALKRCGVLVALTCEEGELWRRLKKHIDRRPLLAGGRPALRALLKKRRTLYKDAVLSVSATRRSPEQVARVVADRLKRRGLL